MSSHNRYAYGVKGNRSRSGIRPRPKWTCNEPQGWVWGQEGADQYWIDGSSCVNNSDCPNPAPMPDGGYGQTWYPGSNFSQLECYHGCCICAEHNDCWNR